LNIREKTLIYQFFGNFAIREKIFSEKNTEKKTHLIEKFLNKKLIEILKQKNKRKDYQIKQKCEFEFFKIK